MSQLTTRLGALKLISACTSFKTRLMIANGILMSKLIYQISLWGGADSYLLNSLQLVQNRAARFVTQREKLTPVKQLLSECGWLSVRQLEFFHSTIQVHKTIQSEMPKYLYQRITGDGSFPCNTRLAASSSIRIGASHRTRLNLAEKSFICRGTIQFLKKLERFPLFFPLNKDCGHG